MNKWGLTRPAWQLVVMFFVLWAGLFYGLAALFPGVRTDHAWPALVAFGVLTALLAGRIAWIFR